eukprot:TRINITY_DN29572_c0_g1_i1.p1 TRINITY_DN29572_c0_g1~~TRINITY_DN29572_c0_g1_i1.p1  ORF type:complete len:1395 (+),score=342.03 TRINITY_DN29572_c0_g1_i1:52-4185(+)
MALLSEATRQRLEQRRVEDHGQDYAVAPLTTGVHRLGGFSGHIRCAAVATAPCPQIPGDVVWTGEQDGTVAIRVAPSGDIVHRLQRKKEVHVTCIMPFGVYMWCGMSDGYVRIFDQQTLNFKWEIKQHAGAIRAMIAVGNAVYTASQDWQIVQWTPDQQSFKYMQMSGHTNAVLCLAAEGLSLFSGGDDCTIRCWDLEARREREDGWPVLAHKGSVRDLVIHEMYLFSASADGALKVWNTQTGDLVRFLDRRDGPLTTLVRDPVSRRLWSGGVDGVICVWDTQTLTLSGRYQDHASTYVNLLTAVCRASALKVWSIGGNGSAKVWFSESGVADQQFATLINQERELQGQVEEMRTTVVGNFEELEQRKDQLRRIEHIDGRRKEALALTFGHLRQSAIRVRYYQKVMRFVGVAHRKRLRTTIAATMGRCAGERLAAIYLVRLGRYRKTKIEDRAKTARMECLRGARQRTLRSTYWQHLLQYTRQQELARRRRVVTGCVGRTSKALLQAVYWKKLALNRQNIVRARKQSAIADSMLRNYHKGLAATYWRKLQQMYKYESYRVRRQHLRAMLMDQLDGRRGTMLRCLFKWENHHRTLRRRMPHAILTQARCSRSHARRCYNALLHNVEMQKINEVASRISAHASENDSLRTVLTRSTVLTDDEISKEIADAEQARIEHEAYAEERLKALEALKQQKLQRRRALLLTHHEPDQSKSERAQFDEVMRMLKAKSIHCDYDHVTLTDLVEQAKGDRGARPAKTYESGMNKVKRAIERHNAATHGLTKAESFPSDCMGWVVIPGDDGSILGRTREKEAALGIRMMIFAADCMSIADREGLKCTPETLANAGILLDIVLSDYKKRKRKAERSGSARGRRSPQRASSRRSLSPGSSDSPGRVRRGSSQSPGRRAGSSSRRRAPVSSAASVSSAGGRGSPSRGSPPRAGSSGRRRAPPSGRTASGGRSSPARAASPGSASARTDGSSSRAAAPRQRADTSSSSRRRQPQARSARQDSSSSRRRDPSRSKPRDPAIPQQQQPAARAESRTVDTRGAGRSPDSQRRPLRSPRPQPGSTSARRVPADRGTPGRAQASASPTPLSRASTTSASPVDAGAQRVGSRRAAGPSSRGSRTGAAAAARSTTTGPSSAASAGSSERERPRTRRTPHSLAVSTASASEAESSRPFLGIEMIPREQNRVHGVRPDGPAAKVGVSAGDTLVTINGHTIRDSTDLQEMEGSLAGHVGEKLEIVVRDGEGRLRTIDCSVRDALEYSRLEAYDRVHAAPNPRSPRGSRRSTSSAAGQPYLGMSVNKSRPALCECSDVTPGGPAHLAGIMDGDVIVSVNGEAVAGRADFGTAFRRFAVVGGKMKVGFTRQGKPGVASIAVTARP